MKSEITRAQTKEFVPIELKIKIESKEELAAWLVQLTPDLMEAFGVGMADNPDPDWVDMADAATAKYDWVQEFDSEVYYLRSQLWTYYDEEDQP